MLPVALMLICLFSTSAYGVLGLDPMGPPASRLKQGQFRAGAEYSYSETDIEANNPKLSLSGVDSPGLIASTVLENVESNRLYANLGFGLVDGWEVFLRVGAADIHPDKSGNSTDVGGYVGNSDFDVALGAGTKIAFWESRDKTFAVGALGQLSWTTLDYDQSDASIGLNANTDIEFLQVQVAVGPIFSPVDGFSIYGGPFFTSFTARST